MEIVAIEGAYESSNGDDLEFIFASRPRDNSNSFILNDGRTKYPALQVLVKGDIAFLYYMPPGDSAGFQSVGHMAGLEGTMTNFTTSMDGEQLGVQNRSIVPFAVALAAAKEFMASGRLPDSVEWDEL